MPGATEHSYAYLLGLYLGDGTLSSHPRDVYRLRVFLDRTYPLIIGECGAAMSIVLPASKVCVLSHKKERMEEVSSFSKHWPHLFPQHGPGVKHERKIVLELFFSNRSLDIQRIFCDACDRLDIAWRQDGPWNISVARRGAVALLDRHVGPKR